MKISLLLPTVVFLGALVLIVEGVNVATGGSVYVAGLQQLAQEAQIVPIPPATSGGGGGEGKLIQPQQPTQPPTNQQQLQPSQPAQPVQQQPPKQFEKQQPTQIEPQQSSEPQNEQEEFVDPREIQQALREIKQLKSELKRFVAQLKRLANSADDLAKINEITSDLDRFYGIISNPSASGSDVRDAIQAFRDNQYWDEVNKIRAKVELPKEIKQISLSVKRVESAIKQKTFKNLGLNLENVQQSINEMKQNLETVQSNYQNGNLDEAMEAMQYFHEGNHPGEIEGTIFRIRDLKQRLKQVKDTAIRAEVDKTLQEVIDTFNQGEYRDARETLDEYADDLMRLIDQFLRSKMKRGTPTQGQIPQIQNLQNLIGQKLQEKGDAREKKELEQKIQEQQNQIPGLPQGFNLPFGGPTSSGGQPGAGQPSGGAGGAGGGQSGVQSFNPFKAPSTQQPAPQPPTGQ